MNKVIRQHVTATPTLLHRAEGLETIQFWIPRTLSADQYDYDASVVFFASNEDACSIEDGVPLLFDARLDLQLTAGEEIWLVTTNEAYCGAVVTTE